MPPLRNFIDFSKKGTKKDMANFNKTELKNILSACKSIQETIGCDPWKDHYIINVGGSKPSWTHGFCPCLTRSRCGSRGYFATWLCRKLTVKEMWLLMGLPRGSWSSASEAISEAQLGKIIGNGISIPMLASVMKEVFTACGMI